MYTVAPLLLLITTAPTPGGTVHSGAAVELLSAGRLVLLMVPPLIIS
jgi:hypothetical protein